MIIHTEIQSIIQESLDLLHESGLIESKILADSNQMLFGLDSPLDSMGFVNFMTDLEDRLTKRNKRDIFIVLSDLDDMFPNEKSLTIDMLTRYINKLLKSNAG